MITFKSFMELDELFELLVARFWIEPPVNLTHEELDDWTKQKQVKIRLRVLNTFRTMITDEDVLEKDDMYILDRIHDFCLQAERTASVAAAKQLVVLIERVVCISRPLVSDHSHRYLLATWRRGSHQDYQHDALVPTTVHPP